MRIATVLAATTILLAACGGDDSPGDPDAPPTTPDAPPGACTPTPSPALLPGPFQDPAAIELPAACVAGGLRDLPGRWFVRTTGTMFSFEYPAYAGDCDQGFRRANVGEDDLDQSDNFTTQQWSDGTRIAHRFYVRYPATGEVEYEYDYIAVSCMLPDGTLAGVEAEYTTDSGESMAATTGHRIELDVGPGPMAKLGELRVGAGGVPIVAYNVFVEGTHAYTAGPQGFDVIDISDPAAPVAVAHVPGNYNDVKVVRSNGKVVAFASPIQDEATSVIDVTDPTAPVPQTQISEYSHSVQVRTSGAQVLLYLATYTDKVPVYDVTNPLVPVRLGEATVPGESGDGIHDLFAEANIIYANSTTAGLVALDVSAGLDSAVELGRIATSYSHAVVAGVVNGRRIVLHGDEGMTPNDGGAFLRVLEGDPASDGFINTELARFQTRPEVGIHNLQLVGDLLYISYYQDGIRVVDLSDATNPTEVAHYNTWNIDTAPGTAFEGAIGVRVVGDKVYVADSLRGLIILETPSL